MDGQSAKPVAKPLRFVTNYGAPHPKRRRIGAACLTCRKRKTACSGERPFCETCAQTKLDCAGYAAETGADAQPRKQSHSTTHHRAQDSIDPALRNEHPSQPQPHHVAASKVSPSNQSDQPRASLFSGPRNRMPYFRWLGPTAIMPGFKQMVVKIKRQDNDAGTSSADGAPALSPPLHRTSSTARAVNGLTSTPLPADEVRTPVILPFYDTSPVPPSEMITDLAQTFFTHLGCNFPFLQRVRFLRDLEEKQVDAILVDAVCALAARFSTHPSLTPQSSNDEPKPTPTDFGHAFAQRAKLALLDTFACPTVAAVQAALLLAYNEFGESRDSGLWVYLGIAIRMAQDLGMHKIEGLRYRGMTGPTPRMVKMEGSATLSKSSSRPSLALDDSEQEVEEQKAVEQERVDTFWAIFFLDRVVSSGTGRRSTLRDKDIELSFPLLSAIDEKTGWPAPFPALIRIVHLYGRVADLLNGIKEPGDITTDTSKRLAAMESQVTHLYQGLSTKLHFDAVNFQHYVKAGEGTNFVLLHFWFHTLIVLLHQPTLLKTFEGNMLQLFPNSQQLSMSSAKTIADILSYSQLIDAKACLGNPFTTQPIYIAACAFLRETAEHTATSNAQSRATSPQRQEAADHRAHIDRKVIAKHTLLATAATQHYQLCYKALQSLETYWSGTKYILTVLEQKFEGVRDPLLYTVEEGESAMEQPKPDAAFKVPGWRRTQSFSREAPGMSDPDFNARFWEGLPQAGRKGSVAKAIGWTLTGNMDSPSTNLAWHYPSGNNELGSQSNASPSLPLAQQSTRTDQATMHFPITSSDVNDASLLLGLHTPFEQSPPPHTHLQAANRQNFQMNYPADGQGQGANLSSDGFQVGGMMIEQQDIDTSMLGLDMMPWFDPGYAINNGDMMGLYDVGQINAQPAQSEGNDRLPHG
ncbi:hypothetical protein AMS68_001734 [Peltaster fructicola]|uniref:Zn(2)-C6 fungal-type domain-containing protein n=1 Tax=Peltaster fructicola TaxID=286661 RepID=A0A6H0XN87_9PEZI|nr:hypothetical protein AMS68_001734 [Peltaster fructicola]